MKWYEIVGIIAIICVLSITVVLAINSDKDEILQDDTDKVKITGKYAEAICEISKIPCPENVEFEGFSFIHANYDDYVGYSFNSKNKIIHFRILLDQELLVSEKRLVDGVWETMDWTIWSFDESKLLPLNNLF